MSFSYAKIFEKIFDSTLANDWQVRIVFQDMLILSDKNGIVNKTPEALSRRTGVPLEVVRRAIEVLEAPDPESESPEDDGRRIVRIDEHRTWGWQIVNKGKYREMKNPEEEREKVRLRVERHRQKRKNPHNSSDHVTAKTLQGVTVTDGNAGKRHADAEANADAGARADARASSAAFGPDSPEMRLALYLFKWMRKNNPQAKEPNFDTWAKDFDKILRIDRRDVEEVKHLIEWTQKHTFWLTNILSPRTLREKYDKLMVQKEKGGDGGANSGSGKKGDDRFSDYRD